MTAGGETSEEAKLGLKGRCLVICLEVGVDNLKGKVGGGVFGREKDMLNPSFCVASFGRMVFIVVVFEEGVLKDEDGTPGSSLVVVVENSVIGEVGS